VAVAWVDRRGCVNCSGLEIFLTIVDASGARTSGEVQVSAPSNITKAYPRVVFDGEALAVVWLEATGTTGAKVKLRRFDTSLAPVGDVLDVGPIAGDTPPLAGTGLASAGRGEYGIAMWLFMGKQSFTHVTCTGAGTTGGQGAR